MLINAVVIVIHFSRILGEATHKIPPEGLSTQSYQQIYEDTLAFVNPRKLNAFPSVYCKVSVVYVIHYAFLRMYVIM